MSDKVTLTELLRDATSAIITLANDQAVGAHLPINNYTVMWMEPTDPQRSQGRFEDRTEPAFHLIELQQPELSERLNADPAVRRFLSAATDFADKKGSQPPGLSPSAEDLAFRLLAVYFDRVGSFRLDDTTLNEVCTQFVYDLEASTATVESIFLIERFNASAQFNLSDGISFRAISDEDIDRFGRVLGFPGTRVPDHPWLDANNWICEIQQLSPKHTMEIINRHDEFADQVIGALNLSAEGRSYFTLLANRWKSPFVGSGTTRSGRGHATSGIGNDIDISTEDVESFKSIYWKIEQVHTVDKLKHLQLPFRRLRLAAARTNDEDRLVDYVVGLERLLSPDSENLETTFRFRLRGAALLPKSLGNPRERIDLMNSLYRLRSRVVHGNADTSEVNEFLPKAETVLKAIFLWYLNHIDTFSDSQAVIRELDEALVAGGLDWAYDQ